MPRRAVTPFAALFAVLGTVACGNPGARAPSLAASRAPFDSVAGVASFDTAWARINATYYDTGFRGHDWKAERLRYRPLAERASSNAAVRQAIESLFVKLEDSHFALIPGEVALAMRGDSVVTDTASPGTSGLQFRFVSDRLVVSQVVAGSAAAHAGVRAGWELLAIDGLDVPRMLAARQHLSNVRDRRRAALQIPMRAESMTRGARGTVLHASFRQGDGKAVRVELSRGSWDGDIIKYGPLPPQYFGFAHERYADQQGCVGVIRFNVWMPTLLAKLDRSMESLASCRGLVLDLRGNTGGVAALVMGVSGYFVDREVSLGTLAARGTTLQYMVNPRRANRRGERVQPFSGNLAILVDGLSASTTELFAEGMRDIGRARVFGDTTAGEALPATMARLPNGDVLIHAIADFHSARGRRLEALGVIPDVLVPLTRRDLAQGRDAALNAALGWVRSNAVEAGAGVTQRRLLP